MHCSSDEDANDAESRVRRVRLSKRKTNTGDVKPDMDVKGDIFTLEKSAIC